MKALILAAGFGTRLENGLKTYLADENNSEADKKLVRSWIEGKPKGLVPVKEKPLMNYLLEQLEKAGIRKEKIYIHTNSVHYRQFESWAKNNGISVEKIINNEREDNENRRGPIGDLCYALEKIGCDEPLLVLAQDVLVFGTAGKPYDLGSMLNSYHRNGNSRMVVYEGENSRLSSHGVVKMVDGRIVEFEEKPKLPKSNWASAFAYLYNPAVLQWIKKRFRETDTYANRNLLEFIDFEEFLFEAEKVHSRLDIGRIEDVLRANDLL